MSSGLINLPNLATMHITLYRKSTAELKTQANMEFSDICREILQDFVWEIIKRTPVH